MSDCEKATLSPGSETLIEAGCRLLGLGVGDAELEPPQAARNMATTTIRRIETPPL